MHFFTSGWQPSPLKWSVWTLSVEGLGDDPTPPTDDEENDAKLPEPTEPQDEDVKTDEVPEEDPS